MGGLKQLVRDEESNKQFCKSTRKAPWHLFCAIAVNVQENVLALVKHLWMVAQAWEALNNQYVNLMNRASVLNLKNQPPLEKLVYGDAIEAILTEIKGLHNQMAAVGLGVKSNDLYCSCL